MLIDKLKEEAKNGKVTIYFDMDGTLVEYGANEKERILINEPRFYFFSRPLWTTIKIMKKLSKMKNVSVGILSNCYFPSQKEDKLAWLDKFVPFVKKENVHIIVLSEENYTKEDKDFLKAKRIEKLKEEGEIVHLIEDDHGIIKSTLKYSKDIKPHHLTELLY